MANPVTTIIDPDSCIGCGECIKVCPSGTISIIEGQAVVTGDRSLACGHCAAVCPADAIQVTTLENDAYRFSHFKLDRQWLRPGGFDIADLVHLMASRRSCRNFSEQPMDPLLLEDLVKIGTTAPSATNSQLWTFTILPDREAVGTLALLILDFFKRINKMARKNYLRFLLKLVGRGELDAYYREFYKDVVMAIDEFERAGRDRLFHEAPAVIIVGSKPEASLPQEDALLATQNILLAAHSLGLGSCLIGFAVEAIRNDPGIKRKLGFPADEAVYTVIALGYTNEEYQRITGRLAVRPRYFRGDIAEMMT